MNLDLKFYIKLFWRRLPVMSVFMLASLTLGVISATKLPETWATSARLLVEAPQIPANMVASTVQIGAAEQLDIIQQKLLTRANLIDIANKFDVFEDIRNMNPDAVLQQMKAATRIRRTVGRNQATLLTIRFEARTGRIAANVVNEYVTLVLEENSDIRLTRAENTLAFFEQEVERLDSELSQQSALIAQFKSENLDALPEDQNYRQGRQSLLQERLSRLERDLALTIKQRNDLTRIFENTGSIRSQQERLQQRSLAERQLSETEVELTQALLIYSDTHPRVAQIKSKITSLKEQVAQEVVAAEADDSEVQTEQGVADRAIFQASLAELDGRQQQLQADIEDTRKSLSQLQSAISRSTGVGIELSSLDRGYANLQARHNAAVNNLNDARMSERIETTAQGQRISVIENASVPRVPAGPNRSQIVLLGAAVGSMLAAGYFLLLEVLNRSVRRPAELINRFKVTPIVTIPYMESRRERALRRGGILTATAIVLVGVPFGLWYIDTNYLPLELVVQKGLARLGLG